MLKSEDFTNWFISLQISQLPFIVRHFRGGTIIQGAKFIDSLVIIIICYSTTTSLHSDIKGVLHL